MVQWCAEESMDLFAQMVPYVFRYLPEYVRAYRVELVQLIVANADPTHVRRLPHVPMVPCGVQSIFSSSAISFAQIESLSCKLTLGEFEMFGPQDAPLVIGTLLPSRSPVARSLVSPGVV
jgi:hypothetical protein